MRLRLTVSAAIGLLLGVVSAVAIIGFRSLEPQNGAWRPLFDGKTLTGWRGYQSKAPPPGWKAVNGTLMKDSSAKDLMSEEEFGDFELELEWKIAKGGNGGLFYRGTEEYEHVYWSAPEYQILDDASAPDAKDRLTSAGAAYALYAPPSGVVKPAGEWNTARIVCSGAHVEHWLNGQKIVEYELWSADWKARVKAAKFSKYPNYGMAKKGHIAFQGDHDGTFALRNIRVRTIGTEK